MAIGKMETVRIVTPWGGVWIEKYGNEVQHYVVRVTDRYGCTIGSEMLAGNPDIAHDMMQKRCHAVIDDLFARADEALVGENQPSVAVPYDLVLP